RAAASSLGTPGSNTCFTGRRHRFRGVGVRMPRRLLKGRKSVIRTSRKLGGVAAIVSFLIALVVSLGASNASGTRQEAASEKVILFASDGMRPDLMEEYARHGSMPTYRALMHAGVRGHNGLMQGFPPNTGVGWATLATGAW